MGSEYHEGSLITNRCGNKILQGEGVTQDAKITHTYFRNALCSQPHIQNIHDSFTDCFTDAVFPLSYSWYGCN